MAVEKALSWAYTEEFPAEAEPARAARERASELGIPTITPATGAVLRAIAALTDARAVVEIGTGAGTSGLWLLQGMSPDGVLTSIDVEPEFQRAARTAFAEAGIRAARTRLIAGRALDVVPRLADGAYDIVFVDCGATSPEIAPECWRLLRPGGVLVVGDALSAGRVADPARRDEATVAMRELVRSFAKNEDAIANLLPTGDGILVAIKR